MWETQQLGDKSTEKYKSTYTTRESIKFKSGDSEFWLVSEENEVINAISSFALFFAYAVITRETLSISTSAHKDNAKHSLRG